MFRLIFDAPADGATNMARDEAISQMVGRQLSPPTLRFYGWSPPAISLGQSMRHSTVNRAICAEHGVGLVRRTTGGLAILHTDELTYSIHLSKTHELAAGDVMTSYRRISVAIMDALTRLGVRDVGAHPVAKADKATGPVCFEAPSDYEVIGRMAAGTIKKLVGSAQQRRLDAVLQHGSLPLSGDIGRICKYLVGAPSDELVRARAGTLAEAVGHEVSWRSAADAWVLAFASVLQIEFVPGDMTVGELALAGELRASRYSHELWTGRR